MSTSHPFVPVKGLVRHVIACNRLHVSTLAGTLQPPMNGKSAARVFANGKPLAEPHRVAALRFLAEKLGITDYALAAFEADPLAESCRELLCRSVGETFGEESAMSEKFLARLGAIHRAARRVLRFDRHLPDDLCFPPDEPVVFDGPRQRGFVLRSAFASFAPGNRPFSFGNQDDRDEPLENLIDQVETGNVDLGIVDDSAASWEPASLGVLGALDGLALFDDNVLLLRWRNSRAVSLVQGDENEAGMHVIRSTRESVERLAGFLAHEAGPAPAIALLENMLSTATWRARPRSG